MTMSYYPTSVLELIKNFGKLPGVGEKTAERLAMHVLRMPRADAERLARSITGVKDKVKICSRCFSLSDGDICQICSDPHRNAAILCVVEQPADMVALERSGAFKGVYHILQGVLSPMDGIGPEDIRIKELIQKVAGGGIQEIVLATSTVVEGEATAAYIAERLKGYPVRITRIASGVPMGNDLKYVDQVTLKRAMDTRHVF